MSDEEVWIDEELIDVIVQLPKSLYDRISAHAEQLTEVGYWGTITTEDYVRELTEIGFIHEVGV